MKYQLLTMVLIPFFTTISFSQIYVDVSNNGPQTGDTWQSAYQSIQSAIDDTRSTSESIWIAKGTYNELLVLKNDQKIYGGFLNTMTEFHQRDYVTHETILDANNLPTPNHAIAAIDIQDIVIDGLIIQNGNASGINYQEEDSYGGGLFCKNLKNSNQILNCVFKNNTSGVSEAVGNSESGNGGAIAAINSIVEFKNCKIEDNFTFRAGGGVSLINSQCNFYRCNFLNNMTGSGVFGGGAAVYSENSNNVFVACQFRSNFSYYIAGGLRIYNKGKSHFEDCEFFDHQGFTGAGGIYVQDSEIEMDRCRIARTKGGALGLSNSTGSFSNCLFYENQKLNEGATGSLLNSNTEFINCTVYNNNVDVFGGGGFFIRWGGKPKFINTIFALNNHQGIYEFDQQSDADLINCLFYDNPVRDYYDFDSNGVWQGAELIQQRVAGGIVENTHDGPPLFVDPENGDFRLLPTSTAIDGGTNEGVTATDFAGNPRTSGSSTDIGAFEYIVPDTGAKNWELLR